MPPLRFPWQNDEGRNEPRVDPVEFARRLRKNSTDAEKRLWRALRNRRFRGLKFRRQHPVPLYVLDFYCEDIKLAVELDGGGHVTHEGRVYDAARTRQPRREGIRVVRISNYEMLVNTDLLLDWLWNQVESLDAE